ncbi:MAG: FkbM family methyltransferase [Dehalococcoidia bacterium]|nr:MAG: FkbM family methyltransferase [Dehalococcoidia bacterium]
MLKETIVSALRYLLRNRVYTVRHGLARGLKMKGGLGFISQIRRLTEEEKFLAGLDLSGQTVYDIGGYEGAFTIFFARAVGKKGRVITFEPHPQNINKIRENIRLNRFYNVGVWQVGLGKRRGKATLAFHRSELATASLQEDIKAKILQEKGAEAIQIEIDSLDSQITANKLPKPDFIKIDVEGLEMDVLLGMGETIKVCKPRLFIEIHGVDLKRKTENVQRVAGFLMASGYSIYHVESRKMINSSNIQIAREGHLYCT